MKKVKDLTCTRYYPGPNGDAENGLYQVSPDAGLQYYLRNSIGLVIYDITNLAKFESDMRQFQRVLVPGQSMLRTGGKQASAVRAVASKFSFGFNWTGAVEIDRAGVLAKGSGSALLHPVTWYFKGPKPDQDRLGPPVRYPEDMREIDGKPVSVQDLGRLIRQLTNPGNIVAISMANGPMMGLIAACVANAGRQYVGFGDTGLERARQVAAQARLPLFTEADLVPVSLPARTFPAHSPA